MDIVPLLRQATGEAFSGEPVVFAYLFGSQATGRARPDSDVDVAVLLDDSVDAACYLETSLRLAGRLAEVSRLPRIEALVVLNEAPLTLAGRIRQERVIIYSRDEPARVRYESLISRRYLDFRLHEAPRDREWLRTVAKGDG